MVNFSGFFFWSLIIVILGNKLGWDYKIVVIVVIMIIVFWSMVINFFWVWCKLKKKV